MRRCRNDRAFVAEDVPFLKRSWGGPLVTCVCLPCFWTRGRFLDGVGLAPRNSCSHRRISVLSDVKCGGCPKHGRWRCCRSTPARWCRRPVKKKEKSGAMVSTFMVEAAGTPAGEGEV